MNCKPKYIVETISTSGLYDLLMLTILLGNAAQDILTFSEYLVQGCLTTIRLKLCRKVDFLDQDWMPKVQAMNDDLIMCYQVTSLDTKLIRWMVDLLLLMVPDQEPNLPTTELNTTVDVSVEKLEEDARNLSGKLDYFSKYITR